MAVQKLREGKRAVGTMVRMIRNSAAAVVAKNAGLDFIMLDLEHGPYSFETVDDVFKVGAGARDRAASCACRSSPRATCRAPSTRAPPASWCRCSKSVEQAQLLVRWAKYAPVGGRGFGGAGGHSNFAGGRAGGHPGLHGQGQRRDHDHRADRDRPGDRERRRHRGRAGHRRPADRARTTSPSRSVPPATSWARCSTRRSARWPTPPGSTARSSACTGPDGLTDRWLPKGLTLVMSGLDTNLISASLKAISLKYKA